MHMQLRMLADSIWHIIFIFFAAGSSNDRNQSPSSDELSCPALASLFASVSVEDQMKSAGRVSSADPKPTEPSVNTNLFGAGLLGAAPNYQGVRKTNDETSVAFESLFRGNGLPASPNIFTR